MFKLDSEEALLASFRSKDRKLVELTPEVQPPIFVRDYVAWAHPAGGRIYLLFVTPGGAPTGIVFDGKTGGGGPGVPVPAMCDWCHSHSVGTGVGLLTATVNAKKRIGVHACADLSCKAKLEEEANRSGRSVVPAIQKLIERMGKFASDGLGIDLSGVTR